MLGLTSCSFASHNQFEVLAGLGEGDAAPACAEVCTAVAEPCTTVVTQLHIVQQPASVPAVTADMVSGFVNQVQGPLPLQTTMHWDANAPVPSNSSDVPVTVSVDSSTVKCLPVTVCVDHSAVNYSAVPVTVCDSRSDSAAVNSKLDSQVTTACVLASDLPVSKRHRSHNTTAQVSHESVMSFLLTLQTQEATVLAATLSVKQAKTRVSRPLNYSEEVLPPPPQPDFLTVVSGLQQDLVDKTTQFYGVVHSFGVNTLLVQVPGCAQLQAMTPGHHYLMVVQPQYVHRAMHLYHTVKAESTLPTSVVLVTQATVVSSTPSLMSWNTLQSVHSTSLHHPGRARKWTAVTDYRLSTLVDQGDSTCEFQSSKHTMAVTANLAGAVHNILLDSGASGTAYATQAIVNDLGLPVAPLANPQGVKMGNCAVVQGLGLCTLPLRLGTLKCKVQCLVLPNLPGYPLILGDPWLQAYKAELSYVTHTVSLTNPQGRVVTLHSATQPKVTRTHHRRHKKPSTGHTTLAELCVEVGMALGKPLQADELCDSGRYETTPQGAGSYLADHTPATLATNHPMDTTHCSDHPALPLVGRGWLSGCKRIRWISASSSW